MVYRTGHDRAHGTPEGADAERGQGNAAQDAFRRWRAFSEVRLMASLRSPASEVVLCVPYLLHRNDPNLPGFQRDQTPGGVVDYNVPGTHRDALRRYFGFRGGIPLTPGGHPAFASIVVEPPLSDRPQAEIPVHVFVLDGTFEGEVPKPLWTKIACIEDWADQRNVRIRIALHTAATSGSVLRPLEADERKILDRIFARGHVLAGQNPFWWLTPPRRDAEGHGEAVTRLQAAGGRSAWDFIDLGTPRAGTSEERIAALLERAVTEPMSFGDRVMLLLDLENALDGDGEAEPLSTLIKDAVHNGAPAESAWHEPSLRLDGISERISERYGPRALRVMQTMCLVELALGKGGSKRKSDAESAARYWGFTWAWAPDEYTLTALKERIRAVDAHADGLLVRDIVAQMIEGLASVAITRVDGLPALRLLLNQLREWLMMSAPLRRGGKIPTLLGSIVRPTKPEDRLRFSRVPASVRSWQVSRGRLSRNGKPAGWEPIHDAKDAVSAVVWAVQNGVIGSNTRVVDEGVTVVTQLAKQLRTWYDQSPAPTNGPSVSGGLSDVVTELYVAQGKLEAQVVDSGYVVPGRGNWDPLNYGQTRSNQLEALVHIERLRAGACRVTSYGDTEGVLVLAAHLASPVGPDEPPALVTVTQERGQRSLGTRLRDLFQLHISVRGGDRVALFELGGRIYGVDGQGRTKTYDGTELKALLAEPGAAARLTLDRGSRRLSTLAAAVGLAQSDPWRVCFSREQHTADVFVCDESGAVHWDTLSPQRLDGHIVSLLDVLRESHPSSRRGPESIEIQRTQDGRVRKAASGHSTLRTLNRKRALLIEGDTVHGNLKITQGGVTVCEAQDTESLILNAATALLARQQPGKEELPTVGGVRVKRSGVPLGPVELVGWLDGFRKGLAREMRRLLESMRKGR